MDIQKVGDVMSAMNVRLVRRTPVMLAICSLGTLTSLASAQSDPQGGTWELNLAKSSFSPGPPPQKQTLTYHAEDHGLTAMLLLQGIDATGKPINPETSNLPITFDGREHPTPNVNYDVSAWKRTSASTYVVTRKKAGKVVLTSTHVVSNDGKTLTITTKGVDSDGHPINNVRVYDKQEANAKTSEVLAAPGRRD
jgi:hypothetical protein